MKPSTQTTVAVLLLGLFGPTPLVLLALHGLTWAFGLPPASQNFRESVALFCLIATPLSVLGSIAVLAELDMAAKRGER